MSLIPRVFATLWPNCPPRRNNGGTYVKHGATSFEKPTEGQLWTSTPTPTPTPGKAITIPHLQPVYLLCLAVFEVLVRWPVSLNTPLCGDSLYGLNHAIVRLMILCLKSNHSPWDGAFIEGHYMSDRQETGLGVTMGDAPTQKL